MTTNTIADNTTDNQLIDLQSSIAHLEVTIDDLNDVITKQDQQLRDLQRQMQLIYNQLNSSTEEGVAPFDVLLDKPPHY